MSEARGNVTIHPNVLTTIVRLTTLSTPGVARLSDDLFNHVGRAIKGATSDSVSVTFENGEVSVDLFVVAKGDVNIRQLGETLQAEITNAIDKMVGLPVREINVYVEDVEASFASS